MKTREEQLNIRITKATKAKLESLAKKRKETVSTLVDRILRVHLGMQAEDFKQIMDFAVSVDKAAAEHLKRAYAKMKEIKEADKYIESLKPIDREGVATLSQALKNLELKVHQ